MSARAVAARLIFVLLGCAALAWGSTTLPRFWSQSATEQVAGQIIDGEQFKPEALAGLISGLETIENARYCRPPADRGGAVIRLRTVEDAISAASSR
jgi:hypothetical protein